MHKGRQGILQIGMYSDRPCLLLVPPCGSRLAKPTEPHTWLCTRQILHPLPSGSDSSFSILAHAHKIPTCFELRVHGLKNRTLVELERFTTLLFTSSSY